jgi:hypothetical protein
VTLPGGIGDVTEKFFGITGDPSDGANTPATLVSWTADNVKELLKQKYIGGAGSGVSVFTNPDGPLSQGLGNIFTGIFNAQSAADYANAQLAVSNRPIVELFDGSGALDSGIWTVTYFGSGGGSISQDGSGNLVWVPFGGITRGVDCRYDAVFTSTNNQIVSTLTPTAVESPSIGADRSWQRIYGRVNESGGANQYGVFGQWTDVDASIGCIVSGTETVFDTQPYTPGSGDTWDLLVGDADPYHFLLKRNGQTVVNHTDSSHVSTLGAGYKATGLSILASARTPFLLQTLPGTLAVFSADDH